MPCLVTGVLICRLIMYRDKVDGMIVYCSKRLRFVSVKYENLMFNMGVEKGRLMWRFLSAMQRIMMVSIYPEQRLEAATQLFD